MSVKITVFYKSGKVDRFIVLSENYTINYNGILEIKSSNGKISNILLSALDKYVVEKYILKD